MQGQSTFHFIMDFLKSDKAAILLIFQGKAFQMTGLNYFIEFYSK